MTPEQAKEYPFLVSKGVLIDLEALSTNPNAAIISLAAAKFTFAEGIQSEFKVNVDPKSCKDIGLHIDSETVKWWGKQPKEIVKAVTSNPVSISEALDQFDEWWGTNNKLYIYCQGGSYDFPVLSSAYIALGRQKPWKYFNEIDTRTIMTIFGIKNFDTKKAGFVSHDSLGDVRHEIQVIREIFDVEAF